jgi:hypothetical protein
MASSRSRSAPILSSSWPRASVAYGGSLLQRARSGRGPMAAQPDRRWADRARRGGREGYSRCRANRASGICSVPLLRRNRHLVPRRPSEPDGQTTGRSGPAPAHASLSAMQAEERGLLTSGTYGRTGNGSLPTSALQSSLESRLRARTGAAGSILYRLIWKAQATPSGRRILSAAGFGMDWRDSAWREWLQRAVRHCPDPVVAGWLRHFAEWADQSLTIGGQHIRQRLYFVGLADDPRRGCGVGGDAARARGGRHADGGGDPSSGLGDRERERSQGHAGHDGPEGGRQEPGRSAAAPSLSERLGDADSGPAEGDARAG